MPLTESQLIARRSSIGSSDIAAVLGLSDYRGPHDVWADKMGESEPFDGNDATRFGEIMEPVLLQWYAEQHPGLVVEPNNVLGEQRIYRRDDWMSATPDALAFHRDSGFEYAPRIIEAKSTSWRMADKWGEPGTDEIPADYLCQVMWQMAVMDIDRADVVVVEPPTFKVYTVHRNIPIEDAMIAKAREFWGYVERQEMPPIDGSEACFHALARRNHGSKYLEGDDELSAMYGTLADAKEKIERMDAYKKLVSAQIMERVGPDHKGYKCDKGSIYWVNRRGSETTDWKSIALAKGATKEEIDAATTTGAPSKYVTVRVKGEK